MRRVIVRSPGVVDIVEAEVPTPGPGEVRAVAGSLAFVARTCMRWQEITPLSTFPTRRATKSPGLWMPWGLARPGHLLGRE